MRHGNQKFIPRNKKQIFLLTGLAFIAIATLSAFLDLKWEANKKSETENIIQEENKIIGVANGNVEIQAWEFRYFSEMYREGNKQKISGDSRNQVMDDVKKYKAQLMAAEENQISLTEKEKNQILFFVNENAKRLASKGVQGNLFWSQALYNSIRKEHFVMMQINLKTIEKWMNKLKSEMPVSNAELLEAYNQDKDLYVIPERAKVMKIAVLQDQSEPNSLPPKAKQIYERALNGEKLKDLVSQGGLTGAEKENSIEEIIMKGLQEYDKENKLFNLRPGETSDFIKDKNFYYLFQMEEIIPSTYRALDDPNVQTGLTEKVKDAKYRSLIEEWTKKTTFNFLDNKEVTNFEKS